MRRFSLRDFIKESNRIEGIPVISAWDISAHEELLAKEVLTVGALADFVTAVAPGAQLRIAPGMDVRVGMFFPIGGGERVAMGLDNLLYRANQHRAGLLGRDPSRAHMAYRLHVDYETLHPFTDGNGRSGRALWLWMMGGIAAAPLGFLHTFYYQSLGASR